MKYRLRFIFIGLAAVLFAVGLLTDLQAQNKTGAKQKKPAQAKALGKVFSHNTLAHQKDACNVCHTIPTRNWIERRPDGEDPFPDVADYPFNKPGTKGSDKHTACVGCHKNQAPLFLSGNFCTGCHTKPGPILSEKDMLPFPNKKHGTQFKTRFPHDIHQDIIASNRRKYEVAVGHFVPASFSAAPDDEKKDYYNCAVCHESAKKVPPTVALSPVAAEAPPAPQKDTFEVATAECSKIAGCFRDVPKNHADCFVCHYQRIKPISSDCKGCHILSDDRNFEPYVARRFSVKFNHDALGVKEKVGEKVHNQDCVTCHLRTAGSSDLQVLKSKAEPEVPYSTCADCHSTQLNEDIEKLKTVKNYQCGYCHTTAVGRFPKPDSHQ